MSQEHPASEGRLCGAGHRSRRCLDRWGKVLMKIGVEGYELALMMAFKEIARRYQPDFLIEVLQGTPEALDELDFLGGYKRYLIGPDGLQKHPKLRADERHSDWLLRAPGRPSAV
jgi:hypothetical protein